MLTPNKSTISLYNVPFPKNSEHVLMFNSKQDQLNYFTSRLIRKIANTKFVRSARDRGWIVVKGNYDQMMNVNYISYCNANYSDKNFYCFVTGMEYVSANATRLYIKEDIFQTWMFDVDTFTKSYIERCTPNDIKAINHIGDTPSVSKLVRHSLLYNIPIFGGWFAFLSADVSKDDVTSVTPVTCRIGSYESSYSVLYFPNSYSDTIQRIGNKGRADRIIGVYWIPFVEQPSSATIKTQQVSSDVGTLNYVTSISESLFRKTYRTEKGFVPNFKYGIQHSYPYSVVQIMDNVTGLSVEYDPSYFNHIENSEDDYIEFEVITTFSDKPSIKVVPVDYLSLYDYSEQLVLNCSCGMPVLNNVYAKYLMSNAKLNQISRSRVNLNRDVAVQNANYDQSRAFVRGTSEIASGIGSLLRADFGGAMSSGMSAIGTGIDISQSGFNKEVADKKSRLDIQEINARENSTATQGNSVTGSSDDIFERLTRGFSLTITYLSLDEDYQLRNEQFWGMYGTPKAELSYVNITSHSYKYYKVIDPMFKAKNDKIPDYCLEEFKNLFKDGLTIWSDERYFMNYDYYMREGIR